MRSELDQFNIRLALTNFGNFLNIENANLGFFEVGSLFLPRGFFYFASWTESYQKLTNKKTKCTF